MTTFYLAVYGNAYSGEPGANHGIGTTPKQAEDAAWEKIKHEYEELGEWADDLDEYIDVIGWEHLYTVECATP